MIKKAVEKVSQVVIRFAGDSGDGMQLTGSQFSQNTAMAGHDLSTLNDFPAEIRAPAGTLYGVSGFQLCFGDHRIHTPGDQVDVLVAMNPASLKASLAGVKSQGWLILNEDGFTTNNLKLAGYDENPIQNSDLNDYRVISIPITTLTVEVIKDLGLNVKLAGRSKNMFALGLMYWIYNRSLDSTLKFLQDKFKDKPKISEANCRLLKAGYHYAETIELISESYEIEPAPLESGTYRNISGTQAMAYGLIAASAKSNLDLFFASYPITPASDLLHALSHRKDFGVKTFQAEDEIAAVCSAIGASYGGHLGVTSTSGPGFALKAEAVGLAVMVELPLVVINVQRAGPSTGMPTKTEQSDLLQACYGRNGESPVAIVSVSSPSDAFLAAYEACCLAVKYRHPVVLLSDGFVANGAEPWKIPDVNQLADIEPNFALAQEEGTFFPYARNPKTKARPWAIPGVVGNEHRIGGLEKEDLTGNVCYDPKNHQDMVNLRADKVAGMVQDIPDQTVYGKEQGDLLLLGWGGTYGSLRAATDKLLEQGYRVGHAHLRYLNPFPSNLKDLLSQYKKVMIPELNLGQLAMIIRSLFLIPVESYCKVEGTPFAVGEIESQALALLKA